MESLSTYAPENKDYKMANSRSSNLLGKSKSSTRWVESQTQQNEKPYAQSPRHYVSSPLSKSVQPSPLGKSVQPSLLGKSVQPSPLGKSAQPSPFAKSAQPSPFAKTAHSSPFTMSRPLPIPKEQAMSKAIPNHAAYHSPSPRFLTKLSSTPNSPICNNTFQSASPKYPTKTASSTPNSPICNNTYQSASPKYPTKTAMSPKSPTYYGSKHSGQGFFKSDSSVCSSSGAQGFFKSDSSVCSHSGGQGFFKSDSSVCSNSGGQGFFKSDSSVCSNSGRHGFFKSDSSVCSNSGKERVEGSTTATASAALSDQDPNKRVHFSFEPGAEYDDRSITGAPKLPDFDKKKISTKTSSLEQQSLKNPAAPPIRPVQAIADDGRASAAYSHSSKGISRNKGISNKEEDNSVRSLDAKLYSASGRTAPGAQLPRAPAPTAAASPAAQLKRESGPTAAAAAAPAAQLQRSVAETSVVAAASPIAQRKREGGSAVAAASDSQVQSVASRTTSVAVPIAQQQQQQQQRQHQQQQQHQQKQQQQHTKHKNELEDVIRDLQARLELAQQDNLNLRETVHNANQVIRSKEAKDAAGGCNNCDCERRLAEQAEAFEILMMEESCKRTTAIALQQQAEPSTIAGEMQVYWTLLLMAWSMVLYCFSTER